MAKSVANCSVANSHRSFASSILKNPSLIGCRNTSDNRVHFKLPSNLEIVFRDAVNGSDVKQYEDLICALKNSVIKDGQLFSFLREVRRNVAMLDETLYKFVDELLRLKWAHRSHSCSVEYEAFLIDLLSTHNYYTKKVLEGLVNIFLSEECYETENGVLTERAKQCCNNVHNVLGTLLKVIPMASHVLCETVRAKYPYFRRGAEEHRSYVSNVLKISLYYPQLQCELFHIVIERLIILDVNIPKMESNEQADYLSEAVELAIFEMEGLHGDGLLDTVAHSLDVTLQCVFQYMYKSCHCTGDSGTKLVWDKTLQFYNNLLLVFDKVMLPTDTTQHVQFLLFYLCSFDGTLLESFLNYLWDKALMEEEDLVIKQKSVAYLAGMVVRAKFVSVSIAQSILARLASWVHSYIDKQDTGFVLVELRRHPMFYAICQAVFYLVAFRHSDLLHPKQNLEFVLKLNIAKMVSSQLNPLRVCLPEIIENFVLVAKMYQLAYCDPIIERNNRNELPVIHHSEHGTVINPCVEKDILLTYFPFDTFILPSSKEIIAPLYRKCEKIVETSQHCAKKCEDEDDFMNEQLSSSIPDMLTRMSVSGSQEECRTDLNISFR
ncbi:RNA polymerase I-specific transcription initiation factor RRN3 isoform X2 [Anabrus simplex]